MARILKVAVIGAGLAGLVTARELKREGHDVVIYEKSNRVGGLWVYDPQVEDDPLSVDPNRKIVHSSLFHSVLATFPREIMGFSDYPFFPVNNENDGTTPGEFPPHEEILQFLNHFAEDFGLIELIRFSAEVTCVAQMTKTTMENEAGWVVESKSENVVSTELFEAVVVCNGHFTLPRLAELPGIEQWPGKQLHSHNYREPTSFRDQIVIVVGGAMSACDISQDISKVAKEVHVSSRGAGASKKLEGCHNLWQRPEIINCDVNGDITFNDGSIINADFIVHCTGYTYAFPFLETNGIVTVDDNRVGPLYKHVFPPQLAPWLSFVGLPDRVNQFHMMELQAKWVACVLSGKTILPSEEEMLTDVENYYQEMEDLGVPKHFTHRLTSANQFEYLNWIAAQAGKSNVDEKTKKVTKDVWNILHLYHGSWVQFRQKYIKTKAACNHNAIE